MKFNMMISGVQTIFPEAEVCYFEEKNKMVVYFLNTNRESTENIENNLKSAELKVHGNLLLLKLKNFQYGVDIVKNKDVIDCYNKGGCVGFAFEDEDGHLIDIRTPDFYK